MRSFVLLGFLQNGLILCPGCPTTHYVDQTVIGLAPILPLPPPGRDFRHGLPCSFHVNCEVSQEDVDERYRIPPSLNNKDC